MKVATKFVDDCVVGAALVDTGTYRVPVTSRIKLAPLRAKIVHRLRDRYAAMGYDVKDVGFLGKIKKAASKLAKRLGVDRAVKKIKANAVKVLKTAKKIVQDPRFAAVISAVSVATAPFGGAALGAGYAALRAGLAVADKITKGDPQAIGLMGQYAAQGTPQAAQVIEMVNGLKGAQIPPWAQNRWIQQLAPETKALLPLG